MKKLLNVTVISNVILFLVICGICGCNDSSFKGNSGKRNSGEINPKSNTFKADKYLKIPCNSAQGEAQVTKIDGIKGITVSIEGQFCNLAESQQQQKLTVIFIIDASGSMQQSDPLIDSSCGRLAATETIVNTLQKAEKNGGDIQVGLQVFGDLSDNVLAPTSISQFSQNLTVDKMCSSAKGGTNYESSLTLARQTLEKIEGKKVVYFITDGAPSVMGISQSQLVYPSSRFNDINEIKRQLVPIYQSGVSAAESLRALDNLLLNIVFLREPANSVDSQNVYIENPESYLQKLSGDPDRVKLADSAGDLVEKISQFKSPIDFNFDKKAVSGMIDAGGYGRSELKIAELTRDSTNPGVWKFVTEPFPLFGDYKHLVENNINFEVVGPDGKKYTSRAIIDFSALE